jgi:flagellar biosynthesis chaperone FliJ
MGENEKDITAWIQDHITNAENFISQASSNYHEYNANESRIAEDKGPCWKGYQQIGMKEKDGRQVPNCVPNESVVKEISGRTPKIFVKTAAVEKKIKELMADRKKAVVPYNKETDPKKKEILKQILIKLTNQIKGYEKNLVQLRDMEEEYLQQMHADAELDTSEL